MHECPACGEPNAATARFCHACGSALAEQPQAIRESRKTVTVLFSDVADSTALGELRDPEIVRGVLTRYFDEMRAVLERHGGTVEKFIGDAVMAVFGVPTAHADDALRAVRAGAEMQDRLAELNVEFERDHGVRLEMRIGINTGTVVAGDPAAGQAIVTGDAVNLAKRLEQAAPPGEMLIGKATYPLVKDAIQVGPLQTFPVKGKAEPVLTLRVDSVDPLAAGVARDLARPLVGRKEELEALRLAFTRAAREPACRQITILGPAGIGKSRLVGEFVAWLDGRATVLTGRCLPYGEGITFWPLREIVRELGGEGGVAAAVAGAEDAPLVTERVLSAVGAVPSAAQGEEAAWGFRKLLEALARRRPLVVVLEDLHWAASPLLDLVEYLLGWARGPLLLVVLARPDLVERRAGWFHPHPNADALVLEPLSEDEADELLAATGGEKTLDPQRRRVIADAAEGNPLFLEQMAAMLAEVDAEPLTARMPPSISALLAERLDQLTPEERMVMERAAVVGREFWRGAVADLSPPEQQDAVNSALMALVRKELIQPEPASIGREDAFRFRHLLILEAAYDAIPKRARADLHERVATWLDANAGERAIEMEEIVGYHLEQAYRHRAALGPLDARDRELGAAAGAILGSAGRRALARGDPPGAVNLLERAVALLEGDAEAKLLPDLGRALNAAGDLARADAALSRAVAIAVEQRNDLLEANARIEWAVVRGHAFADTRELAEVAEHALGVFRRHGDEHGLARAWFLLGFRHFIRCEFAAMDEALDQAVRHARRAGDRREERRCLVRRATGITLGPTPVGEGLGRLREIETRLAPDRGLQAVVGANIAQLLAMRGEFEEARRLYVESRNVLTDVGNRVNAAGVGIYAATIELLAGDAAAARRELLLAYEQLEQIGEKGALSTVLALLARSSVVLGEIDEALMFAARSESLVSREDVLACAVAQAARARAIAEQGHHERAERLARGAVELADRTDSLDLQGDVLMDLAVVLRIAARDGAWSGPVRDAASRYEAKGDVVAAKRARTLLATGLRTMS